MIFGTIYILAQFNLDNFKCAKVLLTIIYLIIRKKLYFEENIAENNDNPK